MTGLREIKKKNKYNLKKTTLNLFLGLEYKFI